ncbi:hypothetical protein SAMN04488109_4167 [Chryseolinea serpens]|uniref:Uncharacterized protein n=1 Tax=Chryseolinea serpens TaxID=947013 RepID=A0A1M5TMC5_9BACT|nr:hypothetical protein [Chryseolinea serpens]SHH51932.1 hypothetical protein SAMN04488109_4167 [Chryseolinea serpens]
MRREELAKLEKEDLMMLLTLTHDKMQKKNTQLRKTQEKLSLAKSRIRKMKDIISYQRKRILDGVSTQEPA